MVEWRHARRSGHGFLYGHGAVLCRLQRRVRAPATRSTFRTPPRTSVGHQLGLGHSSVSTATMYPSLGLCSTSGRSLDPDDLAGIERLYPGGTTPTNTAPVVNISAPASGSSALEGTSVSFAGAAQRQGGWQHYQRPGLDIEHQRPDRDRCQLHAIGLCGVAHHHCDRDRS